jgi:hypothetical protein
VAGSQRFCNANGCAEILADGSLVEWGTAVTSSGQVTVGFPTPFPSGTPRITLTEAEAGAWSPVNVTIYGVVSSWANGFFVQSLSWTGASFGWGETDSFNWIATGN